MKSYTLLIAIICMMYAAASDSQRIGVIDTRELFHRSAEIRALHEQLELTFTRKRFELEPLQEEIEELQGELESKRETLSAEEMSQKEKELDSLLKKYFEKRDEMAAYLAQQEEQLMSPLLDKLQVVIEKVGREEGFDIIIEKDAVVYAATRTDITDKIIEYLEERDEEQIETDE